MDVLYTDNHLLVVVKPAGVLSQADRTGDDDLLTGCDLWDEFGEVRPGFGDGHELHIPMVKKRSVHFMTSVPAGVGASNTQK